MAREKAHYSNYLPDTSFQQTENYAFFGETEEKALCNIRKNIGCLIEYPCFVPGMTVEQTLHYYAIQKGVPDNKKIGEAIQLTGLSENNMQM